MTSSLKALVLPSKHCQMTSRLVGKSYAAASQASGTLHTMAVLKSYQADLQKDLDQEAISRVSAGAPQSHRSCPTCHQADSACNRLFYSCNGCHKEASVVEPVGIKERCSNLALSPLWHCQTLYAIQEVRRGKSSVHCLQKCMVL